MNNSDMTTPKSNQLQGSLYAHTKPNSNNSDEWQLLEEHLRETALLAATFASGVMDKPLVSNLESLEEQDCFGLCFLAGAAGWLHDLGKVSPDFQNYLFEAFENELKGQKTSCIINHSEAGAAWAEENLVPFLGRTLAYLIAGHHAGLPDYNTDGMASLQHRIVSGKKYLPAMTDTIKPFVGQINCDKLFQPSKFQLTEQNYHLWVRMLFSCLVDADWLNTESFMDPKRAALRPQFPSLRELKAKFDSYMNSFIRPNIKHDSASDVLNQARNDVLNACKTMGREGQGGIFQLTVPTGGGKTLSSMAFALEHAICHNKNRIIYVIPYTSIIEQTADVFGNIFGRENILEHHSNFDAEKYDRKQRESNSNEPDSVAASAAQMELAAENWDAPIVVTTNVQFFESLFAAKTKQCRKLHRIMNSVVILDEAQMLKPELLLPCVDMINQLTHSFGVSLVLCTATQPTLDQLNTIDRNNTVLDHPKRIIPEAMEKRLFQDLARVRYHFDPPEQTRTWDELATELAKHDEVLCIVNTRQDCYDLFNELRNHTANLHSDEHQTELPETVHLSALMCGEHRSRVIEKIKDRLKYNRDRRAVGKPVIPIRVISTQLVEAGVDIDFPLVYRAMAGLDSTAQAAGRCNREGSLGLAGGNVIIFNPPKPAPIGILRKGESATRELLTLDPSLDLNVPNIFAKYFQLFYASVNNLDEKAFIRRLTRDVNNRSSTPEVPFRTVGEEFRLIDDEFTVPVIVRYVESNHLIDSLSVEGPHRVLLRKLQRYTVNVSRYGKNGLSEMIKNGLVCEMYPGIYVQQTPGIYNDIIGLDIFSNQLPADACII